MFIAIMSYRWIYTFNKVKCALCGSSERSSGICIASANMRMCNNSSENTAIYFPVNKKDQSQEMILDSWKKALHDWNWKHKTQSVSSVWDKHGWKNPLKIINVVELKLILSHSCMRPEVKLQRDYKIKFKTLNAQFRRANLRLRLCFCADVGSLIPQGNKEDDAV